MGDTSERSKPPSLPPRCPCGFWGSSKTMNLCSKCFADIQKKQPGEDCTSKAMQGSGSSQTPVFSSETTTTTISTTISSITTSSSSGSNQSISSASSASSSPPSAAELPAVEEPSPLFTASREGVSSTETAQGTLCTPTKRPRESASASESEATPEKKPRAEAKDGDGEEAGGTPKQKKRRRCFRCQTKLELVQQELGSCRCGYVFCMLHRLPEQHDCLFDHLGRGREEAVLKMVKLDRKVGRSCQRIGEECS
ncbi:AN1-type zinc finger protein 3-like isoform X2 [Dunckerocampus dactyliophorus]|uniref:AN1-type zinc finger protein 3-like isoform X2 n=1 Tax=Dunckerocampus dactyliophorus TaxID=161453 RepID=UPI0024058D19|nr:AN1-type zinc finger protein 3-like isoform X2 [Dunckerocampus dactyliophorus]